MEDLGSRVENQEEGSSSFPFRVFPTLFAIILVCSLFILPPAKSPEALCLQVFRPSVRACVCAYVRPSVIGFCYCNNLRTAEGI